MLTVDNILLATDLSDHCGTAAKWAADFKRLTGARVIVEHIVELSVSSWLTSAFETLEDTNLRAEAEQKIAEWYSQYAGENPDEVIIRAGSCFSQLKETVEGLEGKTVLVVSMSGKGAVTRFFLGSTAHALASQPPCTLAIVHPEHTGIGSESPIVTGTDLSRNAKHVVALASRLAAMIGTSVEIVHAVGATSSPLVQFESKVDLATTKKRVERSLSRIVALRVAPYTIEVVDADPGDAIVGRAKSADADLIVLGHSGETVLVQNVLGSVAQRVLNHMPCTLLLVPPFDPASTDEEE